MNDDERPGAVAAGLAKLRRDRQARVGSTIGGVTLGVAAATVHPVGLVVGAALVALPQQSLVRGVAGGLAFGLTAVLFTLGLVGVTHGTSGLAAAVAMRQVTGVTAGIGVAAGLVGGLVRGVV